MPKSATLALNDHSSSALLTSGLLDTRPTNGLMRERVAIKKKTRERQTIYKSYNTHVSFESTIVVGPFSDSSQAQRWYGILDHQKGLMDVGWIGLGSPQPFWAVIQTNLCTRQVNSTTRIYIGWANNNEHQTHNVK